MLWHHTWGLVIASRDNIYQTTEAVPPIAIRGPRKTRDALLRLEAGAFIKPLGILLASGRLIWRTRPGLGIKRWSKLSDLEIALPLRCLGVRRFPNHLHLFCSVSRWT
ncbi:hypothetical protein GQ607_013711 [Colletotrichum asianum]|uniref:Uncharacterized protein n=1 Tax=Colletotrichum asianum TaxID=702518 RepID=A0A8H3ZPH9_9PEZI|nr:hypothetical protein GQ607_013711 [Colletotrichum asianum]